MNSLRFEWVNTAEVPFTLEDQSDLLVAVITKPHEGGF